MVTGLVTNRLTIYIIVAPNFKMVTKMVTNVRRPYRASPLRHPALFR